MRRAFALPVARAVGRRVGLAAALPCRSSSAVAIAPSLPALVVARRFASSGARPTAVNVEEFTLNDEVVRRDMEALTRWNELSEAIAAARATGEPQQVLAEVTKGLAMLEELGAESGPIQCESLLCMEGSQAHYNAGEHEAALALARRARASLTSDGKPEMQDRAQIAEIDNFIGAILCKAGRAKEAREAFEAVLVWIDTDARTTMPMQAVAAINMRRAVLTGLGTSTAYEARGLAAAGSTAEAKELFAKALDTLIEGLNKHIDEKDFQLVKDTLQSILLCFEGLGDAEQAVATCRKYTSWCSRHEDAEGVAEGKRMLAAMCATCNIPNPLAKEEEAAAAAAAAKKSE